MDGELDRLRKLYAELGEEHLLDLADERESLTGDAQFALGEELRRRGLLKEPEAQEQTGPVEETERADGFGVGVPGLFPGAAPAVELALEPGGETRLGMVGLISFFDGIELSRACAVLEDADIEPAIEEVAGDPTIGTAARFEVWVSAADVVPAKLVLRRRMGLFPLAEVDENDRGDDEAGAESERVVAEFDSSAEAAEVRDLLISSGFAARIIQDPADPQASVVVVAAEEHEGALALLEARLELE